MARFSVSISDDLNRWLEQQARLNHRSKNLQLEYILATVSKMPFFNTKEFPGLDQLVSSGRVDASTAEPVPPLDSEMK